MRPTLTESEILRLALISLVLGIIIGILYDIFRMIRIFRKTEGRGRLMVILDHIMCFFEDLIFFLIVTVLNVLLLSAYGGGTLRLEALMIQFTVFIIWQLSVGKLTVKLSVWIRAAVIRAIRYIVRPFRLMMNKLRNKQREKRLRKYSDKHREKLKRDFRAS